MIYRNTKTGVVIDSPCTLSGGDWIVEQDQVDQEDLHAEDQVNISDDEDDQVDQEDLPDEEDHADEAELEEDDEVIVLSEMTVNELKTYAAELNIDLGKATKKDDIIQTIMNSDAVIAE